MFVLKSLGKLILGNSEQKELLKLDSGALWRVELDSESMEKAVSRRCEGELGSAVLILRRGPESSSYELLVSILDAAGFESQIGPFRLRQASSFTLRKTHEESKSDSKSKASSGIQYMFYWNEPEGKEANIVWEFEVNNESSTLTSIEMFQMTVAQCIYEVESGKKIENVTNDSIIQKYILTEEEVGDNFGKDSNDRNTNANEEKSKLLPSNESIVYKSDEADFHVFDSLTGYFVPKQMKVIAFISRPNELKPWEFILQIFSAGSVLIHSQIIDPDATQHLDRASFSFIWCHFSNPGLVTTFSLKFASLTSVLSFANFYNQTVYEALNREKWSRVSEEDAKYLLNPLLDVEMTQALPLEFEEEDSSEESSDNDFDQEEDDYYISNSTIKNKMKKTPKNQMLAVGYKSDRSFVARGSSIGVFKTGDSGLEYVTEAPIKMMKNKGDGGEFKLSKMMLHQADSSLLLTTPEIGSSVFKMDLERGEIVEEWKTNNNNTNNNDSDDNSGALTAILPSSKYSQLTGEETFIGLTGNSIFRVDPRLPGASKRVESESKSYAVKNGFNCGVTTGRGELAVASTKGEIRLFNKLDKRAKTLLPMFGDPILGVDVTENGKYLLATCKTYLLLICTESEDDGSSGFVKSLGGADSKPIPKRLQLKPEHVAYMGQQPSFTPARFSTGQSEERAIITSSGPYVITWNMRRVKQGHLHEYQIKKYEDTVVADNFRYNQDRSIVVTLPENVTLISKKSLAAPSPKSFKSSIVEEYQSKSKSQ